jgi:hypothetical protein
MAGYVAWYRIGGSAPWRPCPPCETEAQAERRLAALVPPPGEMCVLPAGRHPRSIGYKGKRDVDRDDPDDIRWCTVWSHRD